MYNYLSSQKRYTLQLVATLKENKKIREKNRRFGIREIMSRTGFKSDIKFTLEHVENCAILVYW